MKTSLFLLLCCLTSELCAHVEEGVDDYDDDTFTLYVDNDVITTEDRGYTNGLRLSWVSRNYEKSQLPELLQGATSWVTESDDSDLTLGGVVASDSSIRYNWGVSLSQLIFTPENVNALTPPEGERQYAGWLGFGVSIHAKDEHILNSLELTVGTTGSASLAQDAQEFIHELIDAQEFMGWDSQVPTEVTLNLHASQKYRLGYLWDRTGLGVDGYAEWGGSLGNFRTDLFAGMLMRAGFNLSPEFSDPRLSVNSYSHRLFNTPNAREARKFSLYGFAGIRTSLVAHDITIDGPVFRDWEAYNTREPYVRELLLGVGIRYYNTELVFAQVRRSREFKEDLEESQIFGSVALRFAF